MAADQELINTAFVARDLAFSDREAAISLSTSACAKYARKGSSKSCPHGTDFHHFSGAF